MTIFGRSLKLAGLMLMLVLLSADMYPDASNSKLPDARTNLGLGAASVPQFGGIMLSGGAMTSPTLIDTPGSRSSWYGNNPGQRWQLAIGSAASPILKRGAAFSISEYFRVPLTECTAPYNIGCATALLIDVTGDAATEMVTSGIVVHAISSSTNSGTDVQAINAISEVSGSSTSSGMGAFINGRRNTATGHSLGMEVSSTNNTATNCSLGYINIGDCDGILVSSRGLAGGVRQLSSALHIATADNVSIWREGITFNQASVLDTSFMDKSSSTTSISVQGTHTTAIHTDTMAGVVDIGGDATVRGNLTVLGTVNGGPQDITAATGTITKTGSVLRMVLWGGGGPGGNGATCGAGASCSGGGGGGGGRKLSVLMAWGGLTSCTVAVAQPKAPGAAGDSTTVTCGPYTWTAPGGGAGSNGAVAAGSGGGAGAGIATGANASGATGGAAAAGGGAGGSAAAGGIASAIDMGGGGAGTTNAGSAQSGGQSLGGGGVGGPSGGGCNAGVANTTNGGGTTQPNDGGLGGIAAQGFAKPGGPGGSGGSTGASAGVAVNAFPGGTASGGGGGGSGCNGTGTPGTGGAGGGGRVIVTQI